MRWSASSHSYYEWSGEIRLTRVSSALIMGILNVTPDSFSDGGLFGGVEAAVTHALQMIEDGAHIIDVGGESTRPGSEPVSAEEELERVIPVIKAIRERSDVRISIDTTKASVARAALSVGADIINDVSAMTFDPDMLEVAATSSAGIILMHMRGRPNTMQDGDLTDENIVSTVVTYLRDRVATLKAAGIREERIALDPGIGFGKSVEQNLQLIAGLSELARLGRPILLGVSRKSTLGALTGQPVGGRLAATCAAHVFGLLNGAQILRVHDVSEAVDVRAVTAALAHQGGGAHG